VTLSIEQIETLKKRARALYGTNCTANMCGGHGGIRDAVREVYIGKDEDIKPTRTDDGYLVTITVFVPDEVGQ